MKQFAEWFIEFFEKLIEKVWGYISGFFNALYNMFIKDPAEYLDTFIERSKTFNPLEWVLAILFILVFIALVIIIFLVLFQLIKRYLVFTKVELDKQELLYQNSMLERQLRNIYINSTKSEQMLPSTSSSNKTSNQNDQKLNHKRFTKLSLVDEKYKYTTLPTIMRDDEKLTLAQLVAHFRDFAASKMGLYYDHQTIATFFAGMATSKLLILEGISGTGKTSLPYAMGKFFKNETTIIPVQPSWRDRFEMMGYLNDFTKKFNETEFLRALYEANYRTDLNLIVLDEMNLARIEYYFADFLALLELPNSDEWLVELVAEQTLSDPNRLKNGKIQIPTNVWFIGTANKDDSTFGITDKVYDRAGSIEMNNKAEKFEGRNLEGIHVSYDYLQQLFQEAKSRYAISTSTMQAIMKLDEFISKKFEITFGNRILKQFENFIPVFIACGMDELAGIDYLITRKILRKFETLNLPFLKDELKELTKQFDELFGKDRLPRAKEMIVRYTTKL